MQTATWTKLKSGDWGIRVKGSKPARGDVVEVTKKSGETGPAVVDAVLWTGEDRDTGEPIALCAVLTVRAPRKGQRAASTPAPKASAPTVAPTPAARPTGRRTGWQGARKPQPQPAPTGYIDVGGETVTDDTDTPTFAF